MNNFLNFLKSNPALATELSRENRRVEQAMYINSPSLSYWQGYRDKTVDNIEIAMMSAGYEFPGYEVANKYLTGRDIAELNQWTHDIDTLHTNLETAMKEIVLSTD